jgi:L-ascorbate metabolism protein UlaG (beta-lactamase superfamily)
VKNAVFLMLVLTGLITGIHAEKADLDNVLKQIHWLHHASFMVETGEKTVYIDPYEIRGKKPADFIIITHNHPDHLSLADIKKITHRNTLIICTQASADKLRAYNMKTVKPGDEFTLGVIKCGAVSAYNKNKLFHQKKDGNAGFIIEISGARTYFGGDTDFIPEMKNMKNIDIAIVPVGGFYTMEANEAAEAIQAIKPKIAVPMHFGYQIGAKKDGDLFKKMAGKYTRVEILREEEPK